MVKTRSKRSHFGENPTDELMVHAITRVVFFSTREKSKKTMPILINNSIASITIVAIVIITTNTESMGQTVKQ